MPVAVPDCALEADPRATFKNRCSRREATDVVRTQPPSATAASVKKGTRDRVGNPARKSSAVHGGAAAMAPDARELQRERGSLLWGVDHRRRPLRVASLPLRRSLATPVRKRAAPLRTSVAPSPPPRNGALCSHPAAQVRLSPNIVFGVKKTSIVQCEHLYSLFWAKN
jgi:hypothetical protein